MFFLENSSTINAKSTEWELYTKKLLPVQQTWLPQVWGKYYSFTNVKHLGVLAFVCLTNIFRYSGNMDTNLIVGRLALMADTM